ncbi:transmembrane 7 superfamily member 3 isoform X2 [Halyomorpha halys]
MAFFYIKNLHDFNVSCMIAVVPYTNESPLPGGCNMELPVPISPYLSVETNDIMTTIDGPPASLSMKCDISSLAYVSYVMFYKFLHQNEFSVQSYFDSIRSMLTYPRILKSSYVAPKPIEGPISRRIFSRYNGVGSLYSLIAFSKFGNVAVYTPSSLFPYDSLDNSEPYSVALKIQLASFVILCIFLCFGGHRYFMGELFVLGAVFGFLSSYILLFHQTSSNGDLLLMCNGIGFICGILWTSLWWCINSPILSVGLSFVMNGLLISSSVFHIFSIFMGDVTIFQNDLNYWLTYFTICIIVVLISTTNPVKYNIISCATIGAYGIILPFDFYFETTFKYIIVNVINRATVEGFNLALTKPPLQIADLIIGFVWLLVIRAGIVCQKKLTSHRPPFPPVCFILREHMFETTPILSSARFPSYS